MRLSTIRAQDVVVLAKLITYAGVRPTIARLATDLGMGASVVHGALMRLDTAHLVTATPTAAHLHVAAVSEFLVHGVKYLFPARRGALEPGMPTGFAGPPLGRLVRASTDAPTVWPHPRGPARGAALAPLDRRAPDAARHDPALYELLALIDALREHRRGERRLAETELVARVRRAGQARRARSSVPSRPY